jgi:hypothetical protein
LELSPNISAPEDFPKKFWFDFTCGGEHPEVRAYESIVPRGKDETKASLHSVNYNLTRFNDLKSLKRGRLRWFGEVFVVWHKAVVFPHGQQNFVSCGGSSVDRVHQVLDALDNPILRNGTDPGNACFDRVRSRTKVAGDCVASDTLLLFVKQ